MDFGIQRIKFYDKRALLKDDNGLLSVLEGAGDLYWFIRLGMSQDDNRNGCSTIICRYEVIEV